MYRPLPWELDKLDSKIIDSGNRVIHWIEVVGHRQGFYAHSFESTSMF